jgi:hypothetical protein
MVLINIHLGHQKDLDKISGLIEILGHIYFKGLNMDTLIAQLSKKLTEQIKETEFFKEKVQSGQFMYDLDFLEAYINEQIENNINPQLLENILGELIIFVNENTPDEMVDNYERQLIAEQEDELDEIIED